MSSYAGHGPQMLYEGAVKIFNTAEHKKAWKDASITMYSNGCVLLTAAATPEVADPKPERISTHGITIKYFAANYKKIPGLRDPVPDGCACFCFPAIAVAVPAADHDTFKECIDQFQKAGVVNAPKISRHPEKDAKVLYTDDCCTLYEDRLVVTWYYFPFGNELSIPLAEAVKAGTPEDFGISHQITKSWGLDSEALTWFAADKTRAQEGWTRSNVIVDGGQWPRYGFSCNDRTALLAAIDGIFRAA